MTRQMFVAFASFVRCLFSLARGKNATGKYTWGREGAAGQGRARRGAVRCARERRREDTRPNGAVEESVMKDGGWRRAGASSKGQLRLGAWCCLQARGRCLHRRREVGEGKGEGKEGAIAVRTMCESSDPCAHAFERTHIHTHTHTHIHTHYNTLLSGSTVGVSRREHKEKGFRMSSVTPNNNTTAEARGETGAKAGCDGHHPQPRLRQRKRQSCPQKRRKRRRENASQTQ